MERREKKGKNEKITTHDELTMLLVMKHTKSQEKKKEKKKESKWISIYEKE